MTEVDVLDVEISPYGVEQLLPTGDKNDIYNFHLMSNHMSIEKILLLQKYQGLVLHTSKRVFKRLLIVRYVYYRMPNREVTIIIQKEKPQEDMRDFIVILSVHLGPKITSGI